jgi:hypothetical protein
MVFQVGQAIAFFKKNLAVLCNEDPTPGSLVLISPPSSASAFSDSALAGRASAVCAVAGDDTASNAATAYARRGSVFIVVTHRHRHRLFLCADFLSGARTNTVELDRGKVMPVEAELTELTQFPPAKF